MESFSVKTSRRTQFIDITGQVAGVIDRIKLKQGVVLVYVPHTTAAVTINESADPDVVHDIQAKLNKLIPAHEGYTHSEGNSDAHIKSSIIGPSILIPVELGRMVLGTWQGIFFCEFDGPRSRKVIVQVKGQ